MPIDTEIWERACAKAKAYCDNCYLRETVVTAGPPFWKRHPPFDHYPPFNSSDAAMKMLEWLKPRPDITDGRREVWQQLWLNDAFVMPLPLAIANAVLALPD